METNQNTRDGRNKSLWQKNTLAAGEQNAFDPSVTYDVLIVGAGITGLTTAFLLQNAGLKCVIAEAHNPLDMGQPVVLLPISILLQTPLLRK